MTLFNIECVRNYKTCLHQSRLAHWKKKKRKTGSKCWTPHAHPHICAEALRVTFWLLNIKMERSDTALFSTWISTGSGATWKNFSFLVIYSPHTMSPLIHLRVTAHIYNDTTPSSVEREDSKWCDVCVFACSFSVEVTIEALAVCSRCPGILSQVDWFHLFSAHTEVIIVFVYLHNAIHWDYEPTSRDTMRKIRLDIYVIVTLFNLVMSLRSASPLKEKPEHGRQNRL